MIDPRWWPTIARDLGRRNEQRVGMVSGLDGGDRGGGRECLDRVRRFQLTLLSLRAAIFVLSCAAAGFAVACESGRPLPMPDASPSAPVASCSSPSPAAARASSPPPAAASMGQPCDDAHPCGGPFRCVEGDAGCCPAERACLRECCHEDELCNVYECYVPRLCGGKHAKCPEMTYCDDLGVARSECGRPGFLSDNGERCEYVGKASALFERMTAKGNRKEATGFCFPEMAPHRLGGIRWYERRRPMR